MMKFLKHWWLYALVFSLPFERIPSIDVALGGQAVTLRISLFIALAGWLLFRFSLLRKKYFSPRSPIFWLLAYLFVCALSIFVSINPQRSIMVTLITSFTIGTGILVSLLLKEYSLGKIQLALLVSAAIISVFGLYQFLGDSLGLGSGLTGLREIYQKQVFGFPRVQSTALEPLFLGNYMLLPFLLTFSLFITRQRKNYVGWILLLISVVLTLTLSRGAIAASVLGVIICSATLWRFTKIREVLKGVGINIAGCIMAFSMIFVVGAITDNKGEEDLNNYVKQSSQLKSTPTSADSDRVVNKRLAKEAFINRPILGYGVGSFGTYAKQSMPELYADTGNVTVNNEYYEVVSETGLLGLMALVGFVITLFISAVRRLFSKIDLYTRTWVVALSAMSLGFLVQYYAFSTLYILHIWVFIGLLLGLTIIKTDVPEKA